MFGSGQRYALKEELDDVKLSINNLQRDTTEIKTGISMFRWVAMFMVAAIPLVTTFVEEIKDGLFGQSTHLEQLHKAGEAQQILQLQRQIDELRFTQPPPPAPPGSERHHP